MYISGDWDLILPPKVNPAAKMIKLMTKNLAAWRSGGQAVRPGQLVVVLW